MALSPKALSSPPKSNGSNALAALLAAAMHRQPQQSQQQQQQQQQQQLPTQSILNNQEQSKSNIDQMTTTLSSNLPFSSISKSTDKNSTPAAELLIKLVSGSLSNGTTPITTKPTTSLPTSNQTSTKSTSPTETKSKTNEPEHVKLRTLETWYDEDEQPMDCYQELMDEPSSSNGWSADEMFRYNKDILKIESSYDERKVSKNYTTPLPKINSKTTMKIATQLAKEIQDSRDTVTPESSDDDELYENLKLHKLHLNQQKQLDQLRSLGQRHHFTNCGVSNGITPQIVNNSVKGAKKTTKSSSQYSSECTASLSSSPTPIQDMIIKPVTSSSRNILRTCLT